MKTETDCTPDDFPLTRPALELYDAHAAKMVNVSRADWELWSQKEELLARAVSEAFADDTADFNDRAYVLASVRPVPFTRDDDLHRILGTVVR